MPPIPLLPLLLSLLTSLLPLVTCASPMVYFWGSSPVLANETALLLGGPSLLSVAFIQLCPGSPPSNASCGLYPNAQATPAASKVTLPSLDIFSASPCLTSSPASCSPSPGLLLNSPLVKWTQADLGSSASYPGGSVRLFGESLAFASGACVPTAAANSSAALASASVRAVPLGGGAASPLQLTLASCYALTAQLPAGLPLGAYSLQVRNGLPSCGWTAAGQLSVQPPPAPWPATLYPVTGAGGVWGALAAARAAGGGVVYFPRGTYTFNSTLTLDAIPPYTTLLGESAASVSLCWRDSAAPVRTSALIQGSAGHFALRNLSVYVQGNFSDVLGDGGWPGLQASGLVVYALGYYGLLDNASAPFHGRAMPVGSGSSQGSLVSLSGSNWRVSDSQFYGGGSRGFYVHGSDLSAPSWLIGSSNGVLQRSLVHGSFNTYGLESVNGIVMEDNVFEGDLTCYGSFMSSE